MERLRKASSICIYIYIFIIYYKQNTITHSYRLFHPLEGSSGGPYSNRILFKYHQGDFIQISPRGKTVCRGVQLRFVYSKYCSIAY